MEAEIILMCIGLGVCITLFPLFVGLGSKLVKYWTSDRYDFKWGDWVLRKMDFVDADGDPNPCTMLYPFAPLLLGVLYYNGILFEGIIVLVGLLGLVFLPKIVIDISYSIRMNHKTGNAERIDKLESEIEKLRNR